MSCRVKVYGCSQLTAAYQPISVWSPVMYMYFSPGCSFTALHIPRPIEHGKCLIVLTRPEPTQHGETSATSMCSLRAGPTIYFAASWCPAGIVDQLAKSWLEHSYQAQWVVVSVCAKNSCYLRMILAIDIVNSSSTHIQYLLHSSFCSSEPVNWLWLASRSIYHTSAMHL